MADLNRLLVCLDQLALARQQLETREAECGRVAHILTDNAVELMLHYQAEAAARSHGFPLTRRIEKEEQRELVGLHLEPKLRLARELKVLTAEESEFVVTNHYYRNEVYHRGLRHNRVIWDLAWHYHAFACALVPKINAGFGIGYSPDRKVPARLAAFGATHAELMKKHGGVGPIARDLTEKGAAPEKKLGAVLGAAVAAEVRRLDEMLDWTVANLPRSRKRTRLEVIAENQLWAAMFDPQKAGKCRRHPEADERLAKAKLASTDPFEWVRVVLIPPITGDPIKSWTGRARSISAEIDVIKALKKYHSLRLVMDDLVEDSRSAAGALENHLEALSGR
jgi:hypothetical protein